MTSPAAPAPDLLNPMNLFLQADIVVKAVMIGLLLASIWTWAIIIGQAMRLARARRANEAFERDFDKAKDPAAFVEARRGDDVPGARVIEAGLQEWGRSTGSGKLDKEGLRGRLMVAMHGAVGAEVDKLAERLNVLATIGSVAPFVGLFGTVWGIMRSFTSIAGANNTSLAVVAPGIAEALFATALGLFAAIPAVIAYNRMSYAINRVEASLTRFADRFHGTLSRELESVG